MKHSVLLLLPCIVSYCIGQINGYSIDLKEAHDSTERLREYFNSMDQDDKEYGVVFLELLNTWKEEGEKKLLLSQIVPMYLKMLESIKTTELQDVIKSIRNMLRGPNELLKQSEKKLKSLHELKTVKLTDTKVQHAAIKELFFVLRELSHLEKPQNVVPKKMKRTSLRRRRGSQN
ncbi:interferon gamma [Spea bombifrons]|uniref:interferon gamma n=1 Tax=Spea bombifrons TaxID=233779 RepID=UPI00234A0260|nr:interferon gamma [Spea bombifrons]